MYGRRASDLLKNLYRLHTTPISEFVFHVQVVISNDDCHTVIFKRCGGAVFYEVSGQNLFIVRGDCNGPYESESDHASVRWNVVPRVLPISDRHSGACLATQFGALLTRRYIRAGIQTYGAHSDRSAPFATSGQVRH